MCGCRKIDSYVYNCLQITRAYCVQLRASDYLWCKYCAYTIHGSNYNIL